MTYLFIILSLFIFTGSAHTQPNKANTLNISAEGQVELPADIIKFNINLNAEADSPQAAYKLHKKREKALVQLLDKYDIKEKNIHYELISVSKVNKNYNRQNQNEKDTSYQTQQTVNLTLTDFGAYEKMQLVLIENNFDSFSAYFATSKAQQGKDEALKKAIQTAKEKADIITKETGLRLGNIMHINYSDNPIQPVYRMEAKMFQASDSNKLMKYDQSVTISATISIEFKLTKAESK